jgi:DNA-binding winged helix-turn-helix (wHTH) protein
MQWRCELLLPDIGTDVSLIIAEAGPLQITEKAVYWHGYKVKLKADQKSSGTQDADYLKRLLLALADRPDQFSSSEELYDEVWPDSDSEALNIRNNVNAAVGHIRNAFLAIDSDFNNLQSSPGFGYIWRTNPEVIPFENINGLEINENLNKAKFKGQELDLEGVPTKMLIALVKAYPIGDGDDQGHFGVDRLEDRVRSEGRRNVDHRGVGAGLLDRFTDGVEHWQAEVRRAAFAGRHAADHLRSIVQRLARMERTGLPGHALCDDLRVAVDDDTHSVLAASSLSQLTCRMV